ncbi:MAG: cbb3-type cytochrome oxidase subunit 3 [Thermaurantiacus sp.]
MSEVAFGAVEALFLIFGIAFIVAIWFLAFRPSAKERMKDHAMIPFRDDTPNGDGGKNGQA